MAAKLVFTELRCLKTSHKKVGGSKEKKETPKLWNVKLKTFLINQRSVECIKSGCISSIEPNLGDSLGAIWLQPLEIRSLHWLFRYRYDQIKPQMHYKSEFRHELKVAHKWSSLPMMKR